MFDEPRALWIYEQYRWLERCLPKRAGAARRRLVTPTSDFFPEQFTRTHESARALFDRMRGLMGMEGWDCTLVQEGGQQEAMHRAWRNSGVVGETTTLEAAGTFSKREQVKITYSPQLLSEPLNLVALLAHELSHYLLARATEPPACEKKDLEPLTDLTAVAEGFGLFSCHAAFQFKHWTGAFSHGWSVGRLGYMNEAEFAFGLGVFCIRNQIEARVAGKFLAANPRQVFLDSLDFITDLERRSRR